MKKILIILILMFIPLYGYSQATTYKVVDKYEWAEVDRVIVLQLSDYSFPYESALIEEARKYWGCVHLTVVFYRAGDPLPYYNLNTYGSYSQAKEAAINDYYYAIYTYDNPGAEKVTINPRFTGN